MSGLTTVAFFLITLIFSLIIFSLWMRIALRYLRVSPLSPFGRLIYSVTNPIINPVNSLLKISYKPGQKYDWLALGMLVVMEILKITCLSLLVYHAVLPIPYLLIFVIADLIIQPCDLLFYAILFRVIMSFVNPGWHHPIAEFLRLLTDPLLRLGRRIVPDISGFDFSPLIIMVILKVITLFITASLPLRLI